VIRQDRPVRSVTGMTSVPEISLAPMSSSVESTVGDDAFGSTFSTWRPVDMPVPRRPSPIPLVVLALLAGVGAMALGGVALMAATRSADEPAASPPPAKFISSSTPKVERQALALLAKPSTDRVVFRGSGGDLVLVVGSGGRAAILVRGFERAPANRPYYAWIVRGAKVVRAARFTGAERAVFLSTRLGRTGSVVVAPDRAAALRPRSARIVALRGE
jgi:hypothetical protein